MTLRDTLKLVVKGVPITSEYTLPMTEEQFKLASRPKMQAEDDMNPFTLSSPRFLGYFHGLYSREFSIKSKSSYYRKNSISDSIWVHGKIEPTDEQVLTLVVSYYRTNFAKYGQRVLSGSFGLLFLLMNIPTFGNFDPGSFLISNGVLAIFYTVALFLLVSQASGQIDYFEKYFIEDIRKINLKRS